MMSDEIQHGLTNDTPAQVADRYGNRRVPKMLAQVNAHRAAVAAEGTPLIQDTWDKIEEHIDYAYARNAAPAPAEQEPVAVKPLEWILDADRAEEFPAWSAFPHNAASYRIFKAWWGMRGKWGYVCNGGFYHTEQEAKAAAQADYEQRIRSAVHAPAVPDDVAETAKRLRQATFTKGRMRGGIGGQTIEANMRSTFHEVSAWDLDRAADALEAQAADLARYREALGPFAAVAEHDIGDDETDGEAFRPMQFLNRAPKLTVGDLRRARAALQTTGDA